MMAVVIAATGAALVVGQRRIRAAYEELVQEQFRSGFRWFAELQETRLSTVKERCRELVEQSVRVRAALEERDPELIYLVVGDELRDLWDVRTADRARLVFFLLLDAEGRLIPPPASLHPYLLEATQIPPEARLPLVRRALVGTASQQVGMAALELHEPGKRLFEFVITRVPTAEQTASFGILVLGFPATLPAAVSSRPDAGIAGQEDSRAATPDPTRLRPGIWADGNWYAREAVLGPDAIGVLTNALGQRLSSSPGTSGDFLLELNGAPTRVMYQAMNQPATPGRDDGVPYQVGVYGLGQLIRQQAALRRQVLGTGALATILALGLSLALAQGLSGPIRGLVAGAEEVRRGNYRVKVPVRSRDELGELTSAFNEMTAGLELKERYRTVLNSVADETVAQRLIEGGLALGGEVRPVTVLFCDIRGFTGHTEHLSPTEIVDLLNEHMTALTRVVKEHAGVLDKFVGDMLMGLFGAPVSAGPDALLAARCALAIVRERTRLNTVSRHRLQVGVGLASGEVVAGCMGSIDRLNYTVIGKRVNLGSRLCSLAKPGQVVIDESTLAALGELAEARPLEPVQLKGFTGAIQAYELVRLRELTPEPLSATHP